MRLLSLRGDDDVAWKEFPQHAIPPYGILSHTWGTDEVSFSDLVDGLYRQKAGGRKIVFCGRQAARDGLGYFWVDTCCIDKWNKREREQAINSMFSWYKNAARCYVYLADVLVASAEEAGQQSSWEASFRTSRWFKRGWTLQELIAPSSVQFFSKQGQILGNKSTLEQPIHEVTKLPITVLRGCSLDDFSTSERMQWAAGRHTTEPEDGTYCLLGIVGVSLPLTYGEGKEKAMVRLREALVEVPCILPYSRNERFVGREAQLAELQEILFGGKHITNVVITGEGGTGKSQLALELAYRTRHTRKSCSTFWIDAGNKDSLAQSYAHIARRLAIAGWDDEYADVQRLVHAYLEKPTAGEWLLVFDNMDDVDVVSGGGSSLLKALPESGLGAIVFTTIDSDIAKMLAPERTIELGGIPQDSGYEMMLGYLKTPFAPQEQAQVDFLLRELSSLPLAIVHAAAFINAVGMTVKEYRSLLRSKRPTLTRSKQKPNEIPDISVDDPVAVTWLVTFEHLRQAHPAAADYLCFMGCLSAKDVPLEVVVPSSSSEAEDSIQTLGAYALVIRRPADSAVDLHRLVHHAVQAWLIEHQLMNQWTRQAVARLNQVFPNDDHTNRHKWRRLLPHAQTALAHILAESQVDGGVGVQKQSRKHRWLGRWLKSFPGIHHGKLRALIQISAQDQLSKIDAKKDNEAVMSLIWKCAMALSSDGRWDNAEQLQVKELDMYSRKLGDDHFNTLTSMANLAATYWNQGRWDEAEELEVQVMEISKTKLGDDHPDTLTSMNNLATTYMHQHRWTEAGDIHVQVMEMRKTKLGDDHPDTLTSMNNLASTYSMQGKEDKAEPLKKQVMEMRKTKLGDDHPDTLTSMNNLAATYMNQGRWDEAEELEVQVMEISKTKLGDDHPGTLSSMNNLAYTWKAQGRNEAAFKLMSDCAERRVRKLGADHPDTLSSEQTLVEWQMGSLDIS